MVSALADMASKNHALKLWFIVIFYLAFDCLPFVMQEITPNQLQEGELFQLV